MADAPRTDEATDGGKGPVTASSSLRALIEVAPCALFVQRGETLTYANAALRALIGAEAPPLPAAAFWDRVPPDCRDAAPAGPLAAEAEVPRRELRLLDAGGRERWVELTGRALALDGERVTLFSALDVTSRRAAEAEVERLAHHDSLTGLPNRRLLLDRISQAIAQAPRLQRAVAVLSLDLDRFKVINDSLGHAVGDRLLQALAERLRLHVRRGDTVARVGGDEFTLLTPALHGPEDATRIAAKLLEAVREPLVVDGRELFVTGSLGVSIYPGDGHDADTLLRNAEAAMYRAKELGRDTHRTYTVGMNALALERLALETDLRRAIPNEEFVVHYQPTLDVQTERVSGVEALVRWRHPQHGLLPPAVFLELAELIGVVFPLGTWGLRAACSEIRPLRWLGEKPLRVAVNLSARQFQQPDLVAQVSRTLAETGFDPRDLELEITETVAMQNLDGTLATLRELKALGVSLAIDDFGTGHSSLSYLRRFPIDALKIDQSFVRELATDRGSATIVTAIIAMARSLGLRVVAEGVESEEQLAFLRHHRCDQVQGFLISPPLCSADLSRFLTGPGHGGTA